jgi:hypothetical protein
MKPEVWQDLIKRSVLLFLLAAAIMLAISEGVYRLRKDRISRAPQVITLDIPAGTHERVAVGQALAEIPRQMIFVVGDTLVVNNRDSVAHELGPLWVPPGKTASLNLELVSDFTYSCSFTPSKYLGLTVKEATTWKTRLAALWYGAPPLFMFFLVYSFLVWPMSKGESASDVKQGEPANDEHANYYRPEWGWRKYEDDSDPQQTQG